jgi:hypothetical protein
LTAAFVFSGCTDFGTPIDFTDPSKAIIPLRIGNQWVNQVAVYDTLGRLVQQFPDTLELKEDTLIDGTRWFLVGKPKFYYASRSDGIWYRSLENPISREYLLFKFPAWPGERWRVEDGGRRIDTEVLSTSDILTVPAGKFRCYTYRSGSGKTCVAPGIGIVYWESFWPTTTGKQWSYTSELMSYRIQAP